MDGSTLAVEYAFDDGHPGSGSAAKYLRLTDVTYPDGRELHYLYGTSGGLADHLDQIGHLADDSVGTKKYASYTYLSSGSIVKVEHPAVTNGLTLSYDGATAGTYTAWDRFGRIKTQKWTNASGTTTFDQFDYTYDKIGNRKTRDIPTTVLNYSTDNKDQAFSHDGLHRLSGFDKGTLASGSIASPAAEQDYNLDTLGNWTNFVEKANGTPTLNQTRYHNKANEIARSGGNPIAESTGSAWIDPVYDANGNLTEGPKGAWSGDANAATTKIKLVYDAWKRLVQVKDANDVLIATYEYDGRHFRTRKVVEGSPDVTYDFYYTEGWQIIEVRKDSDVDPLKQFVWDLRYIDAPVCRFRDHDTDGTVDDTYYYTNDANFKVTALVQDDGTLDERYEYDPYGKVYVLNADFGLDSSGGDGKSDVDNLITFQGLMLDDETGLIYNRYRHLQTALGRFGQTDPLGYPDGLNTYAAYHVMKGGHDPLGRDASGADCCGPDVTEWYLADLRRQVGYMQTAMTSEKNRRDQLAAFHYLVKYVLAYKWMDFSVDGCGTGKCKHTVMLAGTCIRKNQLGNIAFMFVARHHRPTSMKLNAVARRGYEAGPTYDPEHPYSKNFGIYSGGYRKDNLAAFGVGSTLAFQYMKNPTMSVGQFERLLKRVLKSRGVGRYTWINPGVGPVSSKDLTFVPEFGTLGFDTSNCPPCGQARDVDAQSAAEAHIELYDSFRSAAGITHPTHPGPMFGYWLKRMHEDYTY